MFKRVKGFFPPSLYLKFILIQSCPLSDAIAAAHHSSDSGLSDYQPPAKKLVLKNKSRASSSTYSKGEFCFCELMFHTNYMNFMRHLPVFGILQNQY